MMDLLVQATTSNKISPGGHIINLISKDERNVQYKPNTPIGSLDANTVYIIPKSTLELPVKRMPKLANQPFEQTFRLQVNLPLNQRMVLRVSPRITLDELKKQICSEKELDFSSHHLVHPAQPDTVLDLNATLEVYGCAEISLMSNSGLRDSIRTSSTYFAHSHPPLKTEEEKKKKGLLRLFSRRRKDFVVETSTNGVNHLPPSQSDGATLNRNSYQPKQSQKRKPAPAPPNRNSSPPLITQSSNSINSRPESEISVKTADEIESSVSHSRHSSDSSGYHEPSVFSDCSENKSPEASIVHGDHGCLNDVRQDSPLQKDTDLSIQMKRSSMTSRDTNLKNVPSCSNVSIISASRKRKAPQPPVATLPAIESPSSPEAPPIDSSPLAKESSSSESCTKKLEDHTERDQVGSDNVIEARKNSDSHQESEALQYLENVLQESEQFPKVLDDSDTDSLKDEGEMISVCQAEVHANASDHDSPDSVVESHTVVVPIPQLPQPCNPSTDPLSNLNSQGTGCEESAVPKLVPSNVELPAQNNSTETVNTNYESTVCDGAQLSDDSVPSEADKELLSNQLSPTPNVNLQNDSEGMQKPSANSSENSKLASNQEGQLKSDKGSTDKKSVTNGSRLNSTVTPQTKKKLDNFTLGSYKKDEFLDIYNLPSDSETKSSKNSCLVTSNDTQIEVEVPKRKFKNQPDVKIVSLKDKAKTDIFEENSGRVTEKCAQLNSISTLPLTGRCSSMYNLNPQKIVQKPQNKESEVIINESMKRTHSDQNVFEELKPIDVKACFLQEQKRLQEEYQRLQAQFISWQKQLMNNQSLLQNENILPQMPFSSLVGLDNLENVSKNNAARNESVLENKTGASSNLKTRSLPRPKTKSLSLKESRPKTPPLPSSPTETSVVNIDLEKEECAKRPVSLTACSVDTQANVNLEDKKTQIPSPQDKVVQVPSPQDKVTSGIQVPSPESVKSKEDVSAQTSFQNIASSPETDSISSIYSESEESKSQTLPRPKPKPLSAFQPTQTMTLNRKSVSKPQTVSVTIGSWQQRQKPITDIEPASVASTRSKFQSLENIPQTVNKPISTFMEKRKLPPVPGEESSKKDSVTSSKVKTSELATEMKSTKLKDNQKPNNKSHAPHEQITPSAETSAKVVAGKHSSTIVIRQDEGSQHKQKNETKHTVKEQSALFKSSKPFVKLSSLKDETHSPSIIGLRKWPLSDINEHKSMSDNKILLDDIKASSKRPGGYVQEKIRRAEVDLRKPKSSKTESNTIPKEIEANLDAPKPKASKDEYASVNKNNQLKEPPSKLHITKVNISSRKAEDTKQTTVKRNYTSNVTTPVSTENTWNNTIPKSHSLNSELMSVFNKKKNKDMERYKEISPVDVAPSTKQSVTVNGSVQPPAPPPPPPPPIQCPSSVMPTIPPAEQIPVSSQLLMGKGNTAPLRKESKKSPTKFSRTTDPREELMLEIRGFGGKEALRKVPTTQTGWHLKVFGTASTANS